MSRRANTIHLLETVYSPAAKIDREAGIVREVKVLGRESANGRTYSDRAMDDAAKLYEGAEVNIDHDRKEPYRERGLLEGFGTLQNVSRKSDGVYADLHFLKSHPASGVFLERAERFPDKLGLSHNADGKSTRKGGRQIIESISRVNSVDVVRQPATNKGLFESKDRSMPKTVKQILESAFPKTFSACKLFEDLPELSGMEVEAAPEASAEDQTREAFRQMVLAAFDDEALDTKATAARIKTILQAYDKLAGDNPGGSTAVETEPEGEPEMESKVTKQILESIARIEAREAAREKREKAQAILAEFRVDGDAALLESLVKLPDDKSMRELAERESKLRPRLNGRGPKPLMESRAGNDSPSAYPKDLKEFAAALR